MNIYIKKNKGKINKFDEGWCTNIINSFYSNLNFFDTKKILYVHNTLYKSIIFFT